MTEHLLLIHPSANRVYAAQAPQLAAAELAALAGDAVTAVTPVQLAGVDYLAVEGESEDVVAVLRRHSMTLAAFAREGELLRPVEAARQDLFDEDLVTIPRYPGKTNEAFTRMLLDLTVSQTTPRIDDRPLTVLDPMCGRGTTLTTAWLAGHDAAGVEIDEKAVEQLSAFLKTWLKRKRLKHGATMSPVRREGRSIGRRLDVTARPGPDSPAPDREVSLSVFTGDTRQSAALWGKKRFDAVVVDAPYGVAHGSRTDVRGVSGRDRSAAALLTEAIPVWAGQLRPGGALGIAWNTLGLVREDLVGLVTEAGLEARDEGPWREFAHRVDSSIQRDLLVAVRPVG